MIRHRRQALLLTAILVLSACSAGERQQWLTDMASAERVASEQGKDIFMLLTGDDWCPPCITLDKEVLSQSEFLNYAAAHLVLVKLDFPLREGALTKAQLAHNEKWKRRFPPNGFPTVFLTDAAANRYGQTGYREGGPKKYIEFLRMLKAGQQFRDLTLASAANAAGLERARLLRQVLSLEERWGESTDGILIDSRAEIVDEIVGIAQVADDKPLYLEYSDIKHDAALLTALGELRVQGRESDITSLLDLFKEYDHLSTGRSMSSLVTTIGDEYGRAGKKEEMKAFFQKIVGDDSYPTEFRQRTALSMARALARTEGEDAALQQLEKAVALDPESTVAKNRAQIFNELKEAASAAER